MALIQKPFAVLVGDIAVWLGISIGPILHRNLSHTPTESQVWGTYLYPTESVIRMNLTPIDLVQLQLGLCLPLLGMDEMAQNGSNNVSLPIR